MNNIDITSNKWKLSVSIENLFISFYIDFPEFLSVIIFSEFTNYRF